MLKEGTRLEFASWNKTQRHPIVIYSDSDVLLIKTSELTGENTIVFQSHHLMSYGFLVKASDDVPVELLKSLIYHNHLSFCMDLKISDDVAKYFIKSVVEISRKVEQLLKTNVLINMSDGERRIYNSSLPCNLCKVEFSVQNTKVADHNHLSDRFKQTLNLSNIPYIPVT